MSEKDNSYHDVDEPSLSFDVQTIVSIEGRIDSILHLSLWAYHLHCIGQIYCTILFAIVD